MELDVHNHKYNNSLKNQIYGKTVIYPNFVLEEIFMYCSLK